MMKGQDVAAPATHRGRGTRGLARIAGLASACLALGGLAFAGGFAAFALHVASLETPHDPAPADAIIVLTGGQARIDAAVDLLRSGKGQRLLISGVNPVARVADIRHATGGDEKLFSCCVDLDRDALDTIGNAAESAKWVNTHAYGRVILVTNNYHMPRSLMEMRRHLRGAVLEPYPVVNSRLDGMAWAMKPDALRVLMTEYLKYVAAYSRGLLSTATATDVEAAATTTAIR